VGVGHGDTAQKTTARGTVKLMPVPGSAPPSDASKVEPVDDDPTTVPLERTPAAVAAQPVRAGAVDQSDVVELGRAGERASEALQRWNEAREANRPTLSPGDRVGPYLVVRKLGEGGIGVVHLVEDTRIGGRFALKHLLPSALARPALVRRMVLEAKVMAHVSGHPTVAKLREVGESDELGPYFVMEFVEGQTLAETLRRMAADDKLPSVQLALYIGVTVADALHDLHKVGVIHRDLKPANIHLCPRGDGLAVKILDFGACKADWGDSTATGEATVATVAYMAPEQVLGKGVSGAADQYALGHILYEMLSGQHAYARAREVAGRGDLMHMWQVVVPVDPLSEAAAPGGLAKVVMRALEKDPAKRHPTLRAFADALRAFIDPARAQEVTRPRRKKVARPTVPSEYALPAPPRRELPSVAEGTLQPKRIVELGLDLDEPSLVVLSGKATGTRFVLGAGGTLGSDPDYADVLLDDPTVSKAHLRYNRVVDDPYEPVYALEDLGSLNGSGLGTLDDPEGSFVPIGEFANIQSRGLLSLGNVVLVVLPAGRFRGNDTSCFEPRKRPPSEEPAQAPLASRAAQPRAQPSAQPGAPSSTQPAALPSAQPGVQPSAGPRAESAVETALARARAKRVRQLLQVPPPPRAEREAKKRAELVRAAGEASGPSLALKLAVVLGTALLVLGLAVLYVALMGMPQLPGGR
jgi:serine/threonine-protein kinase